MGPPRQWISYTGGLSTGQLLNQFDRLAERLSARAAAA